jgi:hypothetical protein
MIQGGGKVEKVTPQTVRLSWGEHSDEMAKSTEYTVTVITPGQTQANAQPGVQPGRPGNRINNGPTPPNMMVGPAMNMNMPRDAQAMRNAWQNRRANRAVNRQFGGQGFPMGGMMPPMLNGGMNGFGFPGMGQGTTTTNTNRSYSPTGSR